MILLVVVCAGGLLLGAELPSVSLFVYLTAAARTSPPATSCCSCARAQKGDGEMGHSQHRLHWGELDWTMVGQSLYRSIKCASTQPDPEYETSH